TALLGEDFESADQAIDLALTEGCHPSDANRMRAMAHLVRGDVATAMRLLGRAPANDEAKAKHLIAQSIILLRADRIVEALYCGLRALALTRGGHDERGEMAAMHALAMIYQGVDRQEDAQRIREAASFRAGGVELTP
ncbi:MAG: hypothetical protein KC416_11770, partial [Myxococcales bacterium]|nr:hypothetical protein [Myxococcales bacterium]